MARIWNPGAVILLVLLIGLFFGDIIWAEVNEKVVIISDKIGELIDIQEREYYNILPAIKNFKSAVFLQLPDSSYILEVKYEKDGEKKILRIKQTEEDIEKIRYYIEHYEEIIELKRLNVQKTGELKSKTAAVLWSIGVTTIAPALGILLDWSDERRGDWRTPCGWIGILGGFILGPSTGHFYAEQWGRGLKTVGIRVGIGVAGITGTSILGMLIVEGIDPEDFPEIMISLIPTALAAAAIVGHGVYDITTTPESVRRYNEKVQLKPEINLKEKRCGLGIVYRF